MSDFDSYSVCSSDGDTIAVELSHPDDALRAAIGLVLNTWKDHDVAQVCGATNGEGPDGVPVLLVMRDGAPGSRCVRLTHPSFPWISWALDGSQTAAALR